MIPITLTEDGAWCFFADPRAVYFEGVHQKTYIGWLTRDGHVMTGCYDHLNGRFASVLLRRDLQKDDHANPAIYIDGEGFLTVYYSTHNGDKMYCRRSVLPEDISEWGPEQEFPVNTEGRFGFTYPNPIFLSQEKRRYLFWRGGDFKPNYSIWSEDTGWAPARTLIMGQGARPYIKFASDHLDKICFAFTDGHPNAEPTNSIYCAYYSGGAFYQVDGTPIKDVPQLPLEPEEVNAVYDAATAGGKSWIWDIALDGKNRPVVVYVVFRSDEDHRYWYSRWDGTEWIHSEMCKAGSWFPQTPPGEVETEPYYSGGIILDHQNPSHVYLSRCVEGIFEIEHWETPDSGRTWRSEAITQNSTRHNVRPFVSRGHPGRNGLLLWMHGSYIHWTNYDTQIRMVHLPAGNLQNNSLPICGREGMI